jgi:hypothetical protein
MNPQNAHLDTETQAPAWWTYPYVWMILMGPCIVVLAALWTGFIAHQGADKVLMGEMQAPTLSAAQTEKNHATTRTPHAAPLSLEQQTATHLGDRHE